MEQGKPGTYRSRVGGGGTRHAVTTAGVVLRGHTRPCWPQLLLRHGLKQGAGAAKGATRGNGREAEKVPAGLKEKNESSM